MKSLLKILLIVICFNLWPYHNLKSQINIQNAVFPITTDEQDYLYYFTYTNNFDTAFVTNQVGEFRIVKNNIISRINLIRPLISGNFWQGDSAEGEDLSLTEKSKTGSFVYDSNSSVSFFRELTVGVFCDKTANYPSTEEMNNLNWIDRCFVVGKGRISDKTEFVIQLVRKSDNAILYSIDSIGIDYNPNSIVATRYGTSPEIINNNIQLPNQYAGTQVYIRISPRRWGNTPYGISMSINPSWISLSTFKEYSSSSSYCDQTATEAELNSLDSLHFQKVLNHCDSIKSQTGFLPNGTIARKLMKGDQHYQMIYYYYDSAYYNGNKYYFEKNIIQGGANTVEEQFLSKISDRNLFKIVNIFPMPVSGNIINLTVNAKENLDGIYYEITDSKGGFISKSSSFSVVNGDSIIQKEINMFPGFYYLLIKSGDNNILDFKKILVQ